MLSAIINGSPLFVRPEAGLECDITFFYQRWTLYGQLPSIREVRCTIPPFYGDILGWKCIIDELLMMDSGNLEDDSLRRLRCVDSEYAALRVSFDRVTVLRTAPVPKSYISSAMREMILNTCLEDLDRTRDALIQVLNDRNPKDGFDYAYVEFLVKTYPPAQSVISKLRKEAPHE